MIATPGRTVESVVTEWQGEFHDYVGKVGIVIGGVASGKSYSCAEWLIDGALEAPISQSAIITKTAKQARLGALATFKARLEHYGFVEGRHFVQNKSNLSITMIAGQMKGHRFDVWSIANGAYEALKSTEYDQIWADELQTWDHGEEAFSFLMGRARPSPLALAAYGYTDASGERRCRLRSKIRASANPPDTTANWLHKTFIAPRSAERLKDDQGDEIRVWRVSTYDNYLLPNREEYIDGLKRTMSVDRFKIEVLGESGRIGNGAVYSSFSDLRNVARLESTEGLPSIDEQGHPVYSPTVPLDWLHDFGVNPRVALVAQTHHNIDAFGFQRSVTYVLKEYELIPGSTDLAVREFVRDFNDPFGIRELRLFGDASGQNRNSTTGESDWAMLETHPLLNDPDPDLAYRYQIYRKSANPPIVDRVNSTNARLCNAAGEIGILVHPDCEKLIDDLSETRWILGSRQIDHGSPSKGILRSHLSDALGYYQHYEFPLEGGIAYASAI